MILKCSGREIRFRNTELRIDKQIFSAWEQKMFDTNLSAAQFSSVHGFEIYLSEKEFEELAHSFGYWKFGTVPFEIVRAIEEYSSTRSTKEKEEKL